MYQEDRTVLNLCVSSGISSKFKNILEKIKFQNLKLFGKNNKEKHFKCIIMVRGFFAPLVVYRRLRKPKINRFKQLIGGFSLWLSGKEFACNAGDAGDLGLIPELGRSPGGRNGNPLQYSCLDNPMDRGI